MKGGEEVKEKKGNFDFKEKVLNDSNKLSLFLTLKKLYLEKF